MVTIEYHIFSRTASSRTIDKFWETLPPLSGTTSEPTCARSPPTEFGISVEQFHILRHIRRGSGSVSELAEVRQISRPAISQAVDVLVDKGLILRSQSDTDRRYIRLELTPDGDRLLNAIFEKNRAWMARQNGRTQRGRKRTGHPGAGSVKAVL